LGDGAKGKIRFLREFEDGIKIIWHNSFTDGVDTICLDYYGLDCPHCDKTKEDGYRTRDLYVWTVWNYDLKKQQIFMYAVSSAYTPVMGVLAIYDEFGSVLDRDLIIKRTGKELNTNYTVLNGDTGRTPKCTPWTDEEIFERIKKAYVDMEVEEEEPQKRTRNRKANKKSIDDILDECPKGILQSIATELGENPSRKDSIDKLIDLILLYEEADIREVLAELDDIPF